MVARQRVSSPNTRCRKGDKTGVLVLFSRKLPLDVSRTANRAKRGVCSMFMLFEEAGIPPGLGFWQRWRSGKLACHNWKTWHEVLKRFFFSSSPYISTYGHVLLESMESQIRWLK